MYFYLLLGSFSDVCLFFCRRRSCNKNRCKIPFYLLLGSFSFCLSGRKSCNKKH
jgi:hypothetical protein